MKGKNIKMSCDAENIMVEDHKITRELSDVLIDKEYIQPGSAQKTFESLEKTGLLPDANAAYQEWKIEFKRHSLGLISLDSVEERTAEWLIPNLIPRKAITLLAADGGIGKGTFWAGIAAAVSTGKPAFFEERPFTGEPEKVLVLSAEDSLDVVVRPRLRKAGANLSNIFSVSLTDPRFQSIHFGCDLLRTLTEEVRPGLLIADPLQAFLEASVRMAERNAMRAALTPLAVLCEEYNMSALVVLHTNKGRGNYGRRRVADSSDVWDISRSVLIAGMTQEKGIRYCSHEKSNYGPLQSTILFSINDEGTAVYRGRSNLKDYDYVRSWETDVHRKPIGDDASKFIEDFLSDGKDKEMTELEEMGAAMGFTRNALKVAKARLKEEGKIRVWSVGFKPKKFMIGSVLAEASLTAT